ncbi:MAG: hypothetical protein ISS70_06215 [Phycisphaerae bacterium]|nr:hypothetical protein [Phycisphaerae bacterium]
MDEFTQTIDAMSTQERLKGVFNSLDVRAKLCIGIMWKMWSLERINFSPTLREEIERDLIGCLHDLTNGDCGDPELNWLAGLFHACELVAENTHVA